MNNLALSKVLINFLLNVYFLLRVEALAHVRTHSSIDRSQMSFALASYLNVYSSDIYFNDCSYHIKFDLNESSDLLTCFTCIYM